MYIPRFFSRKFQSKIVKLTKKALFASSTLGLSYLFLDNGNKFHNHVFAEELNLPDTDYLFNQKAPTMFEISLADLDIIPNQDSMILNIKIPTMNKKIPILIIKNKKGNFTAFRGNCPYEPSKVLEGAMVFEDKVVCPHHGCQFCIKTGEVEHSPSIYNLVKLDLKDLRTDKKKWNNFLYRNFETDEHYMIIENEIQGKGNIKQLVSALKDKMGLKTQKELSEDQEQTLSGKKDMFIKITGIKKNSKDLIQDNENQKNLDNLVIFDKDSPDIQFKLYIPDILPHKMYPETYFDIPQDPRRVVIIGNGPAGITCAEVLRRNQFTGRVFVISDSKFMPYDKRKVRLDFDSQESPNLDQQQ